MPDTIIQEDAAPGVALITLNRPDAANALNTAMGRELLEAWKALAARADLRCVVLGGAGRHFAAGADLKERNGMSDADWSAQHRLFEDMIRAQLGCPVPVIAAVQGAAMGGGCEMVLASDFAYAAEGARFGLPEAGLGIIPGLGGTQLLPRAVGSRRALEIMATRRPFSAEEALAWGVVNAVTSADGLMARALEAAAAIAASAPLSVRALKAVVRDGGGQPLGAAMELELEFYNQLFTSQDRREGVAAFNEKRTPKFEGR